MALQSSKHSDKLNVRVYIRLGRVGLGSRGHVMKKVTA